MKIVTIEISEQDYEELVAHYARSPLNYGRPLVAVHNVSPETFANMTKDIERYRLKRGL